MGVQYYYECVTSGVKSILILPNWIKFYTRQRVARDEPAAQYAPSHPAMKNLDDPKGPNAAVVNFPMNHPKIAAGLNRRAARGCVPGPPLRSEASFEFEHGTFETCNGKKKKINPLL